MIFVSRLLPLIRAAFPYAAGVARMPFWRFVTMATLGSIVWIGGLGPAGREVGHQWQTWRHHLEYVDYVGAVVLVAAVVYLIVRWRRSRVEAAARTSPSRRRMSSPTEAVAADPTAEIARRRRRWCWAPCTARPSCCRSPPRATSR